MPHGVVWIINDTGAQAAQQPTRSPCRRSGEGSRNGAAATPRSHLRSRLQVARGVTVHRKAVDADGKDEARYARIAPWMFRQAIREKNWVTAVANHLM